MENKIEARHLNLYYGQKHALKDVSLDIKENKITAFIGPSGCGKSTFLKTLNRMNDYVDNVKIEGDVILDSEDIYDSRVDTTLLRKKSEWFSNNQIHSLCQFMIMSLMGHVFMVLKIKNNLIKSLKIV